MKRRSATSVARSDIVAHKRDGSSTLRLTISTVIHHVTPGGPEVGEPFEVIPRCRHRRARGQEVHQSREVVGLGKVGPVRREDRLDGLLGRLLPMEGGCPRFVVGPIRQELAGYGEIAPGSGEPPSRQLLGGVSHVRRS